MPTASRTTRPTPQPTTPTTYAILHAFLVGGWTLHLSGELEEDDCATRWVHHGPLSRQTPYRLRPRGVTRAELLDLRRRGLVVDTANAAWPRTLSVTPTGKDWLEQHHTDCYGDIAEREANAFTRYHAAQKIADEKHRQLYACEDDLIRHLESRRRDRSHGQPHLHTSLFDAVQTLAHQWGAATDEVLRVLLDITAPPR